MDDTKPWAERLLSANTQGSDVLQDSGDSLSSSEACSLARITGTQSKGDRDEEAPGSPASDGRFTETSSQCGAGFSYQERCEISGDSAELRLRGGQRLCSLPAA